jgi:hypothetical protein
VSLPVIVRGKNVGLLVLAAGAVAAAGCGSTKSDRDQIRSTVEASQKAYAAGDGAAYCELLVDAARKHLTSGRKFGCTSRVERATESLDEASRTRIRSARIRKMDISGDTASVTTTAPGPGRHIELVKIVHGWKIFQP